MSLVAAGEGLPLREQSLIAIVGNELQVLLRDLAQGNEAGAKACFCLITRLYNQSRFTRSGVSEAGAMQLFRFFNDAERALRTRASQGVTQGYLTGCSETAQHHRLYWPSRQHSCLTGI